MIEKKRISRRYQFHCAACFSIINSFGNRSDETNCRVVEYWKPKHYKMTQRPASSRLRSNAEIMLGWYREGKRVDVILSAGATATGEFHTTVHSYFLVVALLKVRIHTN